MPVTSSSFDHKVKMKAIILDNEEEYPPRPPKMSFEEKRIQYISFARTRLPNYSSKRLSLGV